MADGTEVEPTQLMTFSSEVMEAVMPFSTGLGDALQEIAQGSYKLGATNTSEAAAVRLYHQGVMEQTGQFVGEAATGVQALGQGSLTIAANYLAADSAQARGMNTVTEAFMPAPGQTSLSSQQAAARAASDSRDASYAQQIAANRGTLPPVQADEDRIPAAVEPDTCEVDPAALVTQNLEDFGGDENKWAGSGDDQLLTEGTPYERWQAAQN